MKTSWCLGCKYYAYLIGDLCADCDPLAHDENVAVILRIEGGDDSVDTRQEN